jgi:hypothetical protein
MNSVEINSPKHFPTTRRTRRTRRLPYSAWSCVQVTGDDATGCGDCPPRFFLRFPHSVGGMAAPIRHPQQLRLGQLSRNLGLLSGHSRGGFFWEAVAAVPDQPSSSTPKVGGGRFLRKRSGMQNWQTEKLWGLKTILPPRCCH